MMFRIKYYISLLKYKLGLQKYRPTIIRICGYQFILLNPDYGVSIDEMLCSQQYTAKLKDKNGKEISWD